ncbi:hypothetical protein BDV41DRAFT_557422 [Aspergillus transmontanensis]|uniref:Uncharacterized protein n=1 Tax=Aspergillus transmontanensis TaxID=1034304 RepID=A0A5N6VDY5_9EURO|nr:hypothetical protein BDV41DRAFT_557422 [Aspergillus transmontanensis]
MVLTPAVEDTGSEFRKYNTRTLSYFCSLFFIVVRAEWVHNLYGSGALLSVRTESKVKGKSPLEWEKKRENRGITMGSTRTSMV